MAIDSPHRGVCFTHTKTGKNQSSQQGYNSSMSWQQEFPKIFKHFKNQFTNPPHIKKIRSDTRKQNILETIKMKKNKCKLKKMKWKCKLNTSCLLESLLLKDS